ncbi:MAG: AAA family ATPase, partial [Gammaproteobacteria bacterium]|nr:AAA family ATPase [Gammaproteobacteria bacterium]
MRPMTVSEVAGQAHLLGSNQPLSRLLNGDLHSAILWGPPGSGKTTLARLLAANAGAQFIALSAVLAGVKDVRDAVVLAEAHTGEPTVLFLDEVHR